MEVDPASVLRRMVLRASGLLRWIVNHYWVMFRHEWDFTGERWVIPYSSFVSGYERMLKALFYDMESHPYLPNKITFSDFGYFTQGAKKLDHEGFIAAWFDIADSWNEQVTETVYAEFFSLVLGAVVKRLVVSSQDSQDNKVFQSSVSALTESMALLCCNELVFKNRDRKGCVLCHDVFPVEVLTFADLANVTCVFSKDHVKCRSIVATYTTVHTTTLNAYQNALSSYTSIFKNQKVENSTAYSRLTMPRLPSASKSRVSDVMNNAIRSGVLFHVQDQVVSAMNDFPSKVESSESELPIAVISNEVSTFADTFNEIASSTIDSFRPRSVNKMNLQSVEEKPLVNFSALPSRREMHRATFSNSNISLLLCKPNVPSDSAATARGLIAPSVEAPKVIVTDLPKQRNKRASFNLPTVSASSLAVLVPKTTTNPLLSSHLDKFVRENQFTDLRRRKSDARHSMISNILSNEKQDTLQNEETMKSRRKTISGLSSSSFLPPINSKQSSDAHKPLFKVPVKINSDESHLSSKIARNIKVGKNVEN